MTAAARDSIQSNKEIPQSKLTTIEEGPQNIKELSALNIGKLTAHVLFKEIDEYLKGLSF